MNLEEGTVVEEEREQQLPRKSADKPSLFARLRTSIVSGASKGVTLIELLAVIAILAVIAAVAIPVVQSSINKSKISTTKQNLQIISSALQRYYVNHGNYPQANSWVDLKLGSTSPVVTDLKSYIQNMPQDGWQQDYWYKSTSSGFEVATALSAGMAGNSTSDGNYSVTSSGNIAG